MRKNDWIGLSMSLALHLVLLLVFSFMTVAATEEGQVGFIEVEFGPLLQGQPVQQAMQQHPEESERPLEQEQEPEAPPIEEISPVELPDQPEELLDEEQITSPEMEAISPEVQPNPEATEAPEPQPGNKSVRPLGGGVEEGTAGFTEGDDGTAGDERKTAPFQIEGLNRAPVDTPLPSYPEQVNAVIQVRITVDPQGRIVRRIPLLKGNARLEKAVMEALQRWRFNPLPSNAPRENQTGTITFRFQLE